MPSLLYRSPILSAHQVSRRDRTAPVPSGANARQQVSDWATSGPDVQG